MCQQGAWSFPYNKEPLDKPKEKCYTISLTGNEEALLLEVLQDVDDPVAKKLLDKLKEL
jgi:hypothetical protein